MFFKPILSEVLKRIMQEYQVTTACCYAGCGLSNDGWPTVVFR